ncbi:hypothetical protein BDDG_04404 [Blastomyces dermatitidis ATCC 18188]|uniref:Pentatricopeptide repeat protein n=1 Tax=Ajellomyces dermatitidis (strain ATCC 18188 / CBS 674.68) TaxID=653446 RepID=F2TDZ9_AJEDA|nr:hypothetical protein BDDG_04404 [Blastomyces dermatitidis ATCC 18188]
MQLAVRKRLGTRSTLSLLSSLLAASTTLDQLHLNEICLRCAIHSSRAYGNKPYVTNLPKHSKITVLNGTRRRSQDAKLYGRSRPTTTHAKPYGHSLSFQRYLNIDSVMKASLTTSKEEKTPAATSRLSNYLHDSDAFRSGDWRLDPERIKFESDVGHSRDIGTKLVDSPPFANDFTLWKHLLLYRKRHYGDDGVVDIWKGLRERGQPIDLPVEGEYASLFWRNFIIVGWKRNDFLTEVYSYACELYERSGKAWDREKFYKSVVLGLFKAGKFSRGVQWHEKLKDTHLSNPNAMLLLLFEPAVSIDGGLRALRKVCRTVDNHQIYCHTVPFLVKAGRLADALAMHNFLIERNDLPQSAQDISPLIQHLRHFGSKPEIELFLANLKLKGLFQNDISIITLSPTSGNRTSINVPPEVKQKETNAVNDKLGARLFATKTFTFDLILAGVKAFGATAIRPQTLRQMALKAGGAKKLREQIDILKKEGISIGNSAFSKVVQKLASEGNDFILYELLQSNLHPDVLEDLETVEWLFNSSSVAGEMGRARMLFKALSILSTEDPLHYNILLRNAAHMRDWQKIPRMLDQMRQHDISPANYSLYVMVKKILPQRRPGTQEPRNPENSRAITFLIGTLQNMVSTGMEVPPRCWREVLKRLGMSGDWQEFRKLCLWLTHFYSPINPKRFASTFDADAASADCPTSNVDHGKFLPAAHPNAPFRQLFSVHLQYAIIAWGFNLPPNTREIYYNPFSTEREKIIPWIRGHVLLRELKLKGVIVQMNTVRRATRHRLAVLFGEYRVSNRPKNRMLRSTNPWTLEEILEDINNVWELPLFGYLAQEDMYDLVNPKTRTPGQENEEGRSSERSDYPRVSRQRTYREERVKAEKQLHNDYGDY